MAGRGLLAPARRAGPLRRLGQDRRPRPGPLRPPVGDPQRAQHLRRPDLRDRRLPPRPDRRIRRHRRRPRQPAGRPRARLRHHPCRATRRRGHHQQLLPLGVRVRPAPPRPAARPQPRHRAPGPRRLDRRAASGPLRPAAHPRHRRGAAAQGGGQARLLWIDRLRFVGPPSGPRRPGGQPPRADPRRAGGRLLRPDGGASLPAAGPPHGRGPQSGYPHRRCGTTRRTRPA